MKTIGTYLLYSIIAIFSIAIITAIIRAVMRYIYSFLNNHRMIFLKVMLPKSDGKTDREQEKEIAKEALVLTQVLENLAQTTTIDYSKYRYSDLQSSGGMVSELHLKDENNQGITINTTGTCFQASELREQKEN